MPQVLKVEHQDFTFDDDWEVVKYDECADYLRLQRGTHGANASDIVGVHGEWLFIIEVKDYRPKGQAMSHAQLAQWVATKVRDTIAGTDPARWRKFMRPLRGHEGNVIVIVFVEDYESKERVGNRWKLKATVIQDLLREKMKWLGPEVQVVSQAAHKVPGLTVTGRKGAAGRGGGR